MSHTACGCLGRSWCCEVGAALLGSLQPCKGGTVLVGSRGHLLRWVRWRWFRRTGCRGARDCSPRLGPRTTSRVCGLALPCRSPQSVIAALQPRHRRDVAPVWVVVARGRGCCGAGARARAAHASTFWIGGTPVSRYLANRDASLFIEATPASRDCRLGTITNSVVGVEYTPRKYC